MRSSLPAPPATGTADARAMLEVMTRARAEQVRWAGVPLAERLRRVRILRVRIADTALALAGSSASARNRPVREALTAEVFPLAEACRFLERNAQRILAPRRFGWRGRPLWLPGVRSRIDRDPLGVILIIGPGNYPLFLPGVHAIQALVAGNAVVLKPGLGGTAAARALFRLMEEAGFEPGLITLLPEDLGAARAALSALPDKVVFTGSAGTGQQILEQLAPQLTPSIMELSGCDAAIVRADADLGLVVSALVFGLTLNQGATCLAPRRVLVHRSLATELEGRLADALSTADQHRRNCDDRSGMDATVRRWVDEAIAQGAHFVAGGLEPGGGLRLPVVLAGVSGTARLVREDVFRPVLALVTVGSDEEVVAEVNGSPYALGASIFSRDEAAAQRLASGLRVGVVTINDLILPTADARLPFGGRGRSGFGLTRGAEGLLELTVPRVVTATRCRRRFAWDPAQAGDENLFAAYLQLAHGAGLGRWREALPALINAVRERWKNRKQAGEH